MARNYIRKVVLTLGLVVICLATTACSNLRYYQQAISGQIELLTKRRDIDEVLADELVAQEVRNRLNVAKSILIYADAKIGLPVEDSYSAYADLERPYVVWNVFVAQELAAQLETFCFPIAGCVTYKGFFSQKDAVSFQTKMQGEGFETYLGGVAAYSSLGWFSDPLLNTFIHRSDEQLASLLFHELAHKILYIPGDTAFNESFATCVERYALKRWLISKAKTSSYKSYMAAEQRRGETIELILAARSRLAEIYKSEVGDDAKRALKAETLSILKQDYKQLSGRWLEGSEFSAWMGGELNNAKLGAIGAYQGWVNALTQLLDNSTDFAQFVEEANRLAGLPKSEREAYLLDLN